ARGRGRHRWGAATVLGGVRGQGGQYGVVAVDGRLAIGEEGFPYHAVRIADPRLLAFGVAAGGGSFLKQRTVGGSEAGVNFIEFVAAFDLNAEMLAALYGMVAGGNGEVDARIVEHPLGIIGLGHRRLGAEQGRIESDRLIEVLNPDMDVHALHTDFLFIWWMG